MTGDIALRLAAVFALVALGAGLARRGWVATRPRGPTRALRLGRGLTAVVFLGLLPALLFRTAARVDLAALPWPALAAFFMPALALMAAVIASSARDATVTAEPAVRGVAAVFGNTAQLGIPVITALHGEAGLAMHLAIVSVHAIVLLVPATVWAEVALARATAASGRSGRLGSAWRVTRGVVRQSVIHPVVLPVLLGIAWNLAGGTLPPTVDAALQAAGLAALPLCLLLLGVSLAEGGLARLASGEVRVQTAIKLLALPATVWAVASLGFGLEGLTLTVLVLAAALPTGVNALLFAQRYGTAVPAAAATVVGSTLAYPLSVSLWAWALAQIG